MTDTQNLNTTTQPIVPGADQQRLQAMAAFDLLCSQGADKDLRFNALIEAMLTTPHGASSNSLEHGHDTWAQYLKLCTTLESGGPTPEHWPAWLATHGTALLKLQEERQTMQTYLTFHDCGKAWALSRDSQGRVHYPDHADRSAEIWARAGGTLKECELMRKDMVLHTICTEDAAEFAKDTLAPSLLLAAFSELQSNAASIFGGLESTSYKIKIKALSRRANTICRSLLHP